MQLEKRFYHYTEILTIETEPMTDTIKNDFQSLNSDGTCL